MIIIMTEAAFPTTKVDIAVLCPLSHHPSPSGSGQCQGWRQNPADYLLIVLLHQASTVTPAYPVFNFVFIMSVLWQKLQLSVPV